MIKTYRLDLTVLTPVFIGGGSEAKLNRSQYIFDPEKKLVYLLNEAEFIKFLKVKNLWSDYIGYVKRAGEETERSGNPNANNLHLSRWLQGKKISNFALLAREAVKLESPERNITDLNDISCFVRSGLKEPYIPGSSLKGALRNLIISYTASKNPVSPEWRELEAAILENNGKNAGQVLKDRNNRKRMDRIVQNYTPQVDIDVQNASLRDGFRFFSISDTLPLKGEDLFITRSLRLSTYKGKNSRYLKKLPLYIEFLKPGTKTSFYLTLDTDRLKGTPLGKKEKLEEILAWQEERIPDLLGREVFDQVAGKEDIDYYFSCNNQVRPNFILGGHAGFNTKTLIPVLARDKNRTVSSILDTQFKGHRHRLLDKDISPRTLKIAYYAGKYYATGLCRIDIAEEVKL
ncbi:CRISPR type III-A/MTUBE-associated RAMP protein Csm5 [Thermosyntropha lipolytica DSM 11003]|uniref:CRISPR system Cms protein Csm5 n=2 Tax=Thermosyntropha TaxID=54293 RepID=A0A1M5RL68_9FIRM|nr:CRISPR type III-A/MTUBE-associated RAMP protein Csm5 [Thermosyntropha lipolytica DSM 11003]